MVLKPLYHAAPEKISNNAKKIHESMEDMDDIEKTYLYLLLGEMAKKEPEVSFGGGVLDDTFEITKDTTFSL